MRVEFGAWLGGDRLESGAQKLAPQALFVEPMLLLMDEPTNHLDLGACVWLERHHGFGAAQQRRLLQLGKERHQQGRKRLRAVGRVHAALRGALQHVVQH